MPRRVLRLSHARTSVLRPTLLRQSCEAIDFGVADPANIAPVVEYEPKRATPVLAAPSPLTAVAYDGRSVRQQV